MSEFKGIAHRLKENTGACRKWSPISELQPYTKWTSHVVLAQVLLQFHTVCLCVAVCVGALLASGKVYNYSPDGSSIFSSQMVNWRLGDYDRTLHTHIYQVRDIRISLQPQTLLLGKSQHCCLCCLLSFVPLNSLVDFPYGLHCYFSKL